MDYRERLEYLWEDFSSRPERVRCARYAGIVLGVVLVLGVLLVLTRGREAVQRVRRQRPEAAAAPAPSPTVRDAFAFAKDLEPRIRGDARFAKVYLVPSAASANQKFSKVVVMGEVQTADDLRALQGEAVKSGAPVAVEWQVTVSR